MLELFISSLEKQIPVEIMFMNNKGVITDRLIIVKEIVDKFILAYCLKKRKPRIFIKANILSSAKLRVRKGVRKYSKTRRVYLQEPREDSFFYEKI